MSPLKENRKRKSSMNDDVLQNGVKKIKNAKVSDGKVVPIENSVCEEKIKKLNIDDICNDKIDPDKNGKCEENINNEIHSDNKIEPIKNYMYDDKIESERIINNLCDKIKPVENGICEDKTEAIENMCDDKTKHIENDMCDDKIEPILNDICDNKIKPIENDMCEDKAESIENDICEDKAEPIENDICEDKTECIENDVCEEKTEFIENDMCEGKTESIENNMCKEKLVNDTANFNIDDISNENNTCKINEMHAKDCNKITEKDVHKLQNDVENEIVEENIIEMDTKTDININDERNIGNVTKPVQSSFVVVKNGYVSNGSDIEDDENFECDESIRRSLKFDSDSDVDIEAMDTDENDQIVSLTELEKSGKQICFCCKNDNGELIRCSVKLCNNMYHSKCLERLPILKSDAGVCPHHVCLTCYNENPKNPQISKGKMYKCFRCPLAFHKKDECYIPGCVYVTEDIVSCFNHFTPEKLRKYSPIVNLNFCVHCGCNENLIFCVSCPAAVHKECLRKGSLAKDKFMCDRCKSNRTLHYNDVIWVKICNFRWWPAKIINPEEVPIGIQKITHFDGEFPVKFFKTEEYFWVNTGRTYPFVYKQINVEDNVKHNFKKSIAVPYFNEAVQLALAAIEEGKMLKQSNEPVNTKKPPPYKHIKSNRTIGNVQIYTSIDDSDNSSCGCQATDKNPCGYDTICLNRNMLQECHDGTCEVGELCRNRKFVKVQNSACKPFYTDVRGWGLKALEDIKKGHFVIEYVGDLIDEEECAFRIKQKQAIGDTNFYFCTLDTNRIIDAGPKGNFSRFMNHSCDPNCETQKWIVNGDPRVGIFTRHDIKSGTELTFDYQMDFSHYEKLKCNCGTARCSGLIGKKPQNGHRLSQIKTVEEIDSSISQLKVIEDSVAVEKRSGKKSGKMKGNETKKESEKIKGNEAKKESEKIEGNEAKKESEKIEGNEAKKESEKIKGNEAKKESEKIKGIEAKKESEKIKGNEAKKKSEKIKGNEAKKESEKIKGIEAKKESEKIKGNEAKKKSEKIKGNEAKKKSEKIERNETKKQNGKVVWINGVKAMCFKCNTGGKLIECTNKKCDKFFHIRCLKDLKDKVPDNWECPRHFCKICNVKSVYQCEECPQAYCSSHVDKKSKTKKFLCSKHV